MGKQKKTEHLPAVVSHFAFGEQWLEKDEYIGFKPIDGTNWRSEKESFYDRTSRDPKFYDSDKLTRSYLCLCSWI